MMLKNVNEINVSVNPGAVQIDFIKSRGNIRSIVRCRNKYIVIYKLTIKMQTNFNVILLKNTSSGRLVLTILEKIIIISKTF